MRKVKNWKSHQGLQQLITRQSLQCSNKITKRKENKKKDHLEIKKELKGTILSKVTKMRITAKLHCLRKQGLSLNRGLLWWRERMWNYDETIANFQKKRAELKEGFKVNTTMDGKQGSHVPMEEIKNHLWSRLKDRQKEYWMTVYSKNHFTKQ